MAVTPDDIAVELGRTTPDPSDVEYAQWQGWIADALFLIRKRLGPIEDLDAETVDYVVRQAVSRHVRRPDDATQVAVSIDDGSTSRTYRSSRGMVDILDEWWALLSPTRTTTRAFSIRPSGCGNGHMDICSANNYVDGNGNTVFGGAFCSCGAEYTNYQYPLYEGGILSDQTGDEY